VNVSSESPQVEFCQNYKRNIKYQDKIDENNWNDWGGGVHIIGRPVLFFSEAVVFSSTFEQRQER
jgi:hypothetical protein